MDTQFIVLCPGWIKTGGPEALHQLAFHLNESPGVNCSIYYYGKRLRHVIEDYQAIYPVPRTSELHQAGAHMVFPESFDPKNVPCPEGGTRWVWWLSGNRYYPVNHYVECGHLFQSEYARSKLTALGVKGLMLTDYIRDCFVDEPLAPGARYPWIAYNAAKSSLGALLLARTGKFTLVPIKNMTAQEVRYTLSRCRMYIDFGTHPGRDRLPREAALSRCLVVTGREGAAGNKLDIPIPAAYKLSIGELPQSAQRLQAMMDDYEKNIGDFQAYCNSIHLQKEAFRQEVAALVAAVETPAFHTRHRFVEPEVDDFLLKQEVLQREKDYLLFDLASALMSETGTDILKRVS